ncbi:ankyrin [Microthyrium microscopicum]|uniref:Ankyrin n=1 Tax=Microthyrium microscopicum TaxID=703497 RepID=A0A6A6UM74_9PEZI|nr:ankyrin [Microthyrium microscopicum]
MATLTEDESDDILYFARANELADLQSTLESLATTHSLSASAICSAAIDASSQNTPLHYAAGNGHLEIVQFLLKLHGAQPLADTDTLSNPAVPPPAIVNAKNGAGNTALHWAALNGHVLVILELLRHGADPSVLNGAGHDALYEAEVNEKEEAVDVLLKEGTGLDEAVGGDGNEGENGEEGEANGEE